MACCCDWLLEGECIAADTRSDHDPFMPFPRTVGEQLHSDLAGFDALLHKPNGVHHHHDKSNGILSAEHGETHAKRSDAHDHAHGGSAGAHKADVHAGQPRGAAAAAAQEARPKRQGLGELARTSLFDNHPLLPLIDQAPIAVTKPRRGGELGEAAKNSLFTNAPGNSSSASGGGVQATGIPVGTAKFPRAPAHPSPHRSTALTPTARANARVRHHSGSDAPVSPAAKHARKVTPNSGAAAKGHAASPHKPAAAAAAAAGGAAGAAHTHKGMVVGNLARVLGAG